MTEMTRIEAAANSKADPGAALGAEFAAGEHPDTARHRIQHDFIMAVTRLSREPADRKYAYLCRLIERAKEELGHARSASNDVRMAAMQQNIDELIAYAEGHGIRAKLPNRNSDEVAANRAKYFALEEIPAFLGEMTFLIDLWYEQEIAKVHEELLKLTGLAARLR